MKSARRPLPRLQSRKGHGLLALLALRRGRPVDRDWLAGTLWPDSTESAAMAGLRNSLCDLRQALGVIACRQGGYQEARAYLTASLTLFHDARDAVGIGAGRGAIAELWAAGGQRSEERAVRLLAAAEALREATGAAHTAISRAEYERRVGLIGAALDGTALAAEWEAGRAMPVAEAVRFALEEI